MRNRRDTFKWAFLFVVLTVLSLDYWWWGAATRLSLFGLPTWIYYFVALQFVLAAGVFFFRGTIGWMKQTTTVSIETAGTKLRDYLCHCAPVPRVHGGDWTRQSSRGSQHAR